VHWQRGQVVVARDVVDGRPWLAYPVFVVEDTDELLVTYLPEGAPLGYLPDSDHPWYPRTSWYGSGVLHVRRPGDAYSIVHFWRGPGGAFSNWYVNLETPYRRTPIGIDYSDQELDIVVLPDGSWSFKDWDLLDEHVALGRYTPSEAAAIRGQGERIGRELDAGTRWWGDRWINWRPDPAWPAPVLPEGWRDVPVA
jgi:Protein of unknown function (DUF402)